MIEKFKLWWPVAHSFLLLCVDAAVTVMIIVCMFKHEWAEGTFWCALYATWKLEDIKEKL